MSKYPLKRQIRTADRLDLVGEISLKGRCAEEEKDTDHPSLGMQLSIEASSMREGMSTQQKKVGIGVLQQMFREGLAFLGHEVKPDLLPGTVVRVSVPTATEETPARFIGVVDVIEGDILVLRTLDAKGEEKTVRFPHAQFVVETKNGYMGIDGLKKLIFDGVHICRMPEEFSEHRAWSMREIMRNEGLMERDPGFVVPSPDADAFSERAWQETREYLERHGRDEDNRPGHTLDDGEIKALLDSVDDGVRVISPAILVWNELVMCALSRKANAIFFSHDSQRMRIRIRVGDVQEEWASSAYCSSIELLDFVKGSAWLDLKDRQKGQKGSFFCLVKDIGKVAFDVETFDGQFGEDLTIKIVLSS